jgi:hypothetical protein
MKGIIVSTTLALSLGLIASCSSVKKNDGEKEMIAYGPTKVDETKAISVNQFLAQMEGKVGENEFTLDAQIAQVCSKAGCWINIKKPDGKTFMVRFKDHFTIPTKTLVGTQAYLHGVAYWDTIPADLLQHFAEDAGKSPEEIAKITEPSFELAFQADGITFEKTKKK